MGFNVVYSDKDKIESSIAQGGIPKESLILTRGEGESEASYYDDQGNLKPITKKSIFGSMVDANLWISKYDCKGQLISVYIDGDWVPCVVDENNKIIPFISEDDTIILDAGGAPIPD